MVSSSSPDPTSACPISSDGATVALGDAIAELSARIQAATYELLVLIREFDDRGGWAPGWTSCAHWLNWRTGLELGAAREKVRVARALADLPAVSAAMRRGRVSYSKVRAITRVATPETEKRLLDFAMSGTAAHVERLVRAWRPVDQEAESNGDRRRHAGRFVQVWTDDDGMVMVRGRLTPEAGAVLRRALEAAQDQLYRDANEDGTPRSAGSGSAKEAGRRRADGGATRLDNLVLLCRRHHRAVHEEGFTIELDDHGAVAVTHPGGWPVVDAPPAPVWTDAPLAPTEGRLRDEGIDVDGETGTPDWHGEPLDLGWAVAVLHPSNELAPRNVSAEPS